MAQRVLVVDDEKLIVKGIRFSLEQEGMEVDCAYDGEEAVQKAKENEYDIILLDVMLPKLDGFEVCQQIREFSSVPVIMLTAKGDDMDKILGLEYGADDYITKPFNILEVKARIKAIIRRTKKKAPEKENRKVVEKGDLHLDCDSRRLNIGGKEINLTAKEFDLLELMALNPNKVYSRDHLLNAVWGYDYPGDVRTVDVHVRREQARYVLYSIKYNEIDFNIVGVHLQDRRNSDSAQRISIVGRLMNDLKNLEDSSRCRRSVIVGDLNANPYDKELLQMNAFHAVLFKDVIKSAETRTVDGIRYRRLYNPILHFLSENTKNYGSYYDTRGSCTSTWHCFDQALVSKALVDAIESLEYLKSIGDSDLIARKGPKREVSDHLPLFIQIGDMGE